MPTTDLYFQIEGVGETITFIHGNTLDHRLWANQVSHFSNHYQVLAYDLRGFGKSPDPLTSYSHVDDFKNLLASLNIQKTHLVGLSLGGEIAIDATLAHPNLISSLTLINASLSGFPSDVNWDVGIHKETREKLQSNWLSHPLFTSLHRYPQALEQAKQMVHDYRWNFWLHPQLYQKPNPPSIQQLKNIQIPTFILSGGLDLPYFRQVASYLSQNIPLSTLKVLSNLGHLANLEDPNTVNLELEKFILTSSQFSTNTLDAP